MTTDTILATLKFLAVLSTGIWGIIGLMVDYKKDGAITNWGRRALIGTVVSTLIAVVTQSIETHKQNESTREDNQKRIAQETKNGEMLREIRRGLFVIQDASFGAQVKIAIPPDDTRKYVKRIGMYLATQKDFAEKEADDNYALIEDKRALPGAKLDPVVYRLLQPEFVLRIFKDKTKSDCFWKSLPYINKACIPDLVMQSDSGTGRSLSMGIKSGAFFIHLWGIHAALVSKTGESLVSLNDLSGARISFETRYGDNDELWAQEALKSLDLDLWTGFNIGAYSLPLIRTHGAAPKYVLEADFPLESALWEPPKVPKP